MNRNTAFKRVKEIQYLRQLLGEDSHILIANDRSVSFTNAEGPATIVNDIKRVMNIHARHTVAVNAWVARTLISLSGTYGAVADYIAQLAPNNEDRQRYYRKWKNATITWDNTGIAIEDTGLAWGAALSAASPLFTDEQRRQFVVTKASAAHIRSMRSVLVGAKVPDGYQDPCDTLGKLFGAYAQQFGVGSALSKWQHYCDEVVAELTVLPVSLPTDNTLPLQK
jgi:hypothetical protein